LVCAHSCQAGMASLPMQDIPIQETPSPTITYLKHLEELSLVLFYLLLFLCQLIGLFLFSLFLHYRAGQISMLLLFYVVGTSLKACLKGVEGLYMLLPALFYFPPTATAILPTVAHRDRHRRLPATIFYAPEFLRPVY